MGDFSGLKLTTDEAIDGLAAVMDREPAASPERRIDLLTEAAAAQAGGVRGTCAERPTCRAGFCKSLRSRAPDRSMLGIFAISRRKSAKLRRRRICAKAA
ncbi:hypothetical protein [Burkholderia ubonensis]|uniref:hypothetical protein n=1 Tax=Burkholderia ubonensis TaxID=101571 RepID=UPI0015825C53|nr:hypothetical protein [Burkholderia ubonensis]